jgi:hypothetical protein
MLHVKPWMVVVLILIAGLLLSGCSEAGESEAVAEAPAYVEAAEGAEFSRVVLTERAVERLGLETAPVREEQVNGESRSVVPYSAVLYGLNGETWIYISQEPLVFTRATVTIDFIEGDMAVLLDGPPAGTEVASVGASLLYGIDTGVGK